MDHASASELLRVVAGRVIDACHAGHAVRRAWDASAFVLGDGPVVLLAVGKASAEMAATARERLGDRLARGVVVGPAERLERCEGASLRADPRLRLLPADHPLPTPRNLDAARECERLVRAVGPEESLLVLLSGGASAHLASPMAGPMEGVTLEDLALASSALMRAGATIHELNTVRKHVERLKGGRLAEACRARRTLVLVCSDVIANSVRVVGSGPFADDPTTFGDAQAVMARRRLIDDPACAPVVRLLREGAAGRHPETPKAGAPCFARVEHGVVLSNRDAVDAACAALADAGVEVAERLDAQEGEARAWGEALASSAIGSITGTRQPRAPTRPRAAVIAGEWTVSVGAAGGTGGPSQELALAAAARLERDRVDHAMVLALSTDGIDGPTPFAGAILGASDVSLARAMGIDPDAALLDHDSSTLLERVGATLRPGPTGTNVNHVAVLLWW